MATPRRPHLNIYPLKALQLHPPKIHGTQYVWANARANTAVPPGRAGMTSSQLPVDVTQGGIVLDTTHGSRQTEQQPLDIVNSGRSQVAPFPVVAADSLTPSMEYLKDDSSHIAGGLRGGRRFRWDVWDEVPCISKEAWG